MIHCMVDLETLSTRPDAAILSIGACTFDGTRILDTYYENIELESCIRAGLHIDANTVYWWLQQSEAARKALFEHRKGLSDVLSNFSCFYRKASETLWSHGASFDLPILQTAYAKCSIQTPWGYRHARDTRTLYEAKGYVTKLVNDNAHNALSDAIFQAECVMEAMRA